MNPQVTKLINLKRFFIHFKVHDVSRTKYLLRYINILSFHFNSNLFISRLRAVTPDGDKVLNPLNKY